MAETTSAVRLLTSALALVMFLQALLGLLFPDQYRDPGWVKASWFGNDWITLLLAVPLLSIALVGAHSRIHAQPPSLAPGELPIWGTLTIFTTTVALLLLSNIRQEHVATTRAKRA